MDNEIKTLKIGIINTKFIGCWSTQDKIHKNILNLFIDLDINCQVYDPVTDVVDLSALDYLVLTPKECTDLNFKYLKAAKSRPPILCFIGAEGTRMGAYLYQYQEIFKETDHFLVACEAEKKILIELFGENIAISLCPYPVSEKFQRGVMLEISKQEWSKKHSLKIDHGSDWLLYAGRINEQKNIESLLDIVSQSENVNLLIAGPLDNHASFDHVNFKPNYNFLTQLNKKILLKNLYKRVSFLGALESDALCELMKVCDSQISLSSYYAEDYGMSVAEGMSMNLPTVLSDWGGHKNWKNLKDIEFVKMEYHSELGYCLPITKNLQIKKEKTNFNFCQIINENFKNVITTIVTSNTKNKLEPTERLKKFWQKREKQDNQFLYSSIDDPELEFVRKCYLNS